MAGASTAMRRGGLNRARTWRGPRFAVCRRRCAQILPHLGETQARRYAGKAPPGEGGNRGSPGSPRVSKGIGGEQLFGNFREQSRYRATELCSCVPTRRKRWPKTPRDGAQQLHLSRCDTEWRTARRGPDLASLSDAVGLKVAPRPIVRTYPANPATGGRSLQQLDSGEGYRAQK